MTRYCCMNYSIKESWGAIKKKQIQDEPIRLGGRKTQDEERFFGNLWSEAGIIALQNYQAPGRFHLQVIDMNTCKVWRIFDFSETFLGSWTQNSTRASPWFDLLGIVHPTWRIIPVSNWLVTPIYKPFSPFGRGISLLRGLTNHGY